MFSAVWTSAPDTTTCKNNLSKNGTCGISTGVQRCLDIGTKHNNVHEQLAEERQLWNLHGCSTLSGHRHQTQQRARTTCRRTAPVESPRMFSAVWTSAPDTTTDMNNYVVQELRLWNLHGLQHEQDQGHPTELKVTLQEGAEVLENMRRRACPSSSEVLAGNVRRRACPSSSGELLDNVRRKGEGANPSSSEVHSDIADVLTEDVRKRAGVQSLFLR